MKNRFWTPGLGLILLLGVQFYATGQTVTAQTTTTQTTTSQVVPTPATTQAATDIEAASDTAIWNLARCIAHAREHNLQVRLAQIDCEAAETDLKTAQAARYPSLGLSSNQGFTNGNTFNETDGRFVSNPQYTGTYSLSSDLSLFNGGRLYYTLQQRKTDLHTKQLLMNKAQNDIEIAVTNAYLEVLYAKESVKTDSAILQTSALQYEEAQARYEVGQINLSDLSQLKAQYGSDLYNLTVSKNQLQSRLLELKQLLELGPNQTLLLDFPNLDENRTSREVPSLRTLYETALETMPEIKAAETQIASSLLGEKTAKASLLPSLSLSAAVGTGYYTSADFAFLNQLGRNINEHISLSIRIPIYQRREVKSAIDKAVLQTRKAETDYLSAQKDLLSTLENLHQNAIAAQERYKAATVQMQASEESYRLLNEQYQAGLSTLVDVFSEKNNFIKASAEMLKAKYQATLSLCLLDFYTQKTITL